MAHKVEQVVGVIVFVHKGLIITLLAAVREQPLGDLIVTDGLGDILPQAAGIGGGIKGVVVDVYKR